ncbi:MAG TPA: carboxypeptidase-like regulatory domain-containing protein [Gemmatimonadaceae bacterium]|nr:carboxypeptidase-like regulatory domain-containing protein [Gemmatimonadaceae bacterium]
MQAIETLLRRSALILTALVCCAVSIAHAQLPSASITLEPATIQGVALDSLHRGPLRGALLTVHGTTRAAMSDSLGRFRIDSVPPGAYQVDVLHPVLDTIGVGLRTPVLNLEPGKTFLLTVAVPSARTVVAARCTPQEMRIGPGAVLGFVQFAESEQPAGGARVALEFVEVRISRSGVESIPMRREGVVTPSGHFKICALPSETSGAITAFNAADTTGSIGVRVSPVMGVAAFELPDPPSTSTRAGRTSVTGRVVDAGGSGLVRARVSIVGDSSVALTDSAGRFTLGNLRPGTRMLAARRLGFAPVEMPVALHSREPVDLTIRMSERVAMLDTVKVTARRDIDLARVGFSDRKRTGTGYYLGPDQIERSSAYDLPSLLSTAPMLRRVNDGGRMVVTGRSRGTGPGCVTYYLDGREWIGAGIEDFIRPEEVSAIEVYSSNFTPPQFSKGITDCETVVIWTKQRVR